MTTVVVEDVAAIAVPARVTVPASIKDTITVLEDVGDLLAKGLWATAAIVYAWTEPQQGRRTDLTSIKSDGSFTLEEFAAEGIRGLSSINTVRKYRRAWEHAMAQGWATESLPGQQVVLPSQSFTTGPEDAELLVASNENEWYTPKPYIEAARAVLGGIDLDPATSQRANETVQAREIFTIFEDGLTQPWHGRVWLNPPYGRLAAAFASKLVDCHETGDVASAVLLVNAHCTDTDWFQPLWDHTLCFTDHRIDFDSNGRDKDNSSTHGSVFVYLGDEPELFTHEFGKFGAVVRRYP